MDKDVTVDISKLVAKQQQLIFDLQEDCIEGCDDAENLLYSVQALEILLRLQNIQFLMQPQSEADTVNYPVTFSLGK